MRLLITNYTTTPGPGLEKEGKFSGEVYRVTILKPAFDIICEVYARCPESTDKLTIDLDGAYGYSYEWLEEVFGGIIISCTLEEGLLFGKTCLIKATEEPDIVNTIQGIVGGMQKLVLDFEKKKKTRKKTQTETQKITLLYKVMKFLRN